jgi:predicted PhzF superfamily epimerase YddE/YHI9
MRVHSRSGILSVDSSAYGFTLDFSVTPAKPISVPDDLATAPGVIASQIRFCGQSTFDYLIDLDSAAIVRELRPEIKALACNPFCGIIVTATEDTSDHDFLSRYFTPALPVFMRIR